MSAPISLAAVLFLAVVHVFAGKLRFLEAIPRSRFLSMAGGAAVAYVFLHLLPELQHWQERTAHAPLPFAFLEERLYFVGLIGLACFYGIARFVRRSPESARHVASGVFWLHTGSFALYNALIGYLTAREEESARGLAFFALAMALHFMTNDFGLRQDHRAIYDRIGRWVLAGAVLVGWGIGRAVLLPDLAVGVLFAFLAGGVILNVLKEELPEERRSRFGAFVIGAAGYGALLLMAG